MSVAKLKQRARRLKQETLVLYLAARHPDTPWYAKVLAAGVAAYALSPIDLIPDFVPVFGYVDDLLLVPLGIALAVKLVPTSVMDECRARAEATFQEGRPVSRVAVAAVLATWLVFGVLLFAVVWRVSRR
ncbi:MAG: YkvA family protein [Coriobacteriia bacterium]|nr:YkvA family protein [Coriobacteriia bacterium]